MNIIETIKAEVERQYDLNFAKATEWESKAEDRHSYGVWYEGKVQMCKEFLSFLDTIEEPKIVDGEDETELNSLAYLEQLGYTCIPPLNDQDMAQEKWKPIPEQLEAMEFVIRDYREDGCTATANYLQEIYEQIKKL